MLEQSTLLLGPWHDAPTGEPGACVRAVLGSSGTALGNVRQSPPRGPRWLRWLSRRTQEVCELPDGSLVFTLRRGFGWPGGWQLHDADGRLVGTLRGRTMLDGFGHMLALIEQPDADGRGRFLSIEGRELGEYALTKGGPRINFGPDMEGNPFAKMMLLGAVLVRA